MGARWSGLRAGAGGVAAALLLLAVACTGSDPADRSGQGSPVPSPSSPSSMSVASTIGEVAGVVRERVHVFDGIATGVIALVRVGDDTRVVTSGLADVGTGEPMRRRDTFPIASLTKSMVATAVLELVDSGRLGLDDPVEKWLPGQVRGGEQMTVRDLLSHRSGLHQLSDEELPPLDRLTNEELVRLAVSSPLDFEPGTSGVYSNGGYELLGRIVARVTRRPLEQALASGVWRPAGMRHSALAPTTWDVHGYSSSRDVTDQQRLDLWPAAGSVVSTVDDVDAFFHHLWAGDLLPLDLVEEMTTSAGIVAPWDMDYGLGIWFERVRCGTGLGHSGAMSGYSVKAWTLEGADRSVVVVVNDGDGQQIADSIVASALCD
jgi:D-alanyl-D-alanine carboxypeptidase